METAIRTRDRVEERAALEPITSGSGWARHILTVGALLLIVVGVVMRLYALGSHPTGLYHDEAWNGLDALQVIGGAHPLYFPENNGREPFFIYLVAATVRLFGQNPLGVRAAGALCGLLTLAAVYLLGCAWGNRRVGLLSAAILAVTLWHVHLSRMGFRAVSLPLFLALALGLGAVALRSRSRALALAAGTVYGLCFYTYLAARFTPLALAAMGIYGWIWHREWLLRRRQWLVTMAVTALLVLLPLGTYMVSHPETFFWRTGQVAIWSEEINHGNPAGALLSSIGHTLGMFTWQGDRIWRHNVPHRPVFDPLLSVAFLAGVGLAIAGWRRRPAWALCLIWIGVMSLPTLLAEDAPHFLRAVGVLPAAVLLAALALDEGLRRLEQRGRSDAGQTWPRERGHWRPRDASHSRGTTVPRGRYATMAHAGVVGILFASAALTAWDYFGTRPAWAARLSGFDYAGCYRTDPVNGYWHQAQLAQLAQVLNAAAGPVYLDRWCWETFSTIRFLTLHQDRTWLFDAGTVLPPGKPPFSLVTRPAAGVAEAVHALPPGARITVTPGPQTRLNLKDDHELVRAYVHWAAAPLEKAPPLVRFGGGLSLAEARATRTGDDLTVQLGWSVPSPLRNGVRVRVEALNAGGQLVAVEEDWVGTEYYPPALWPAHSMVVQRVAMTLPTAGTGPLQIAVEVDDAASGQPLPIREARVPRQENRILLPGGLTAEEALSEPEIGR